MEHVLLVDPDDRSIRDVVDCLAEGGIDVVHVPTLREGIQMTRRMQPGLILASMDLPDGNGSSLVPIGNRSDPSVPVVVLSARLSTRSVFEAAALGAYDVLAKPVARHDLERVLVRLTTEARASSRCATPSIEQEERHDDPIIGRSARMIEAYQAAGAAARTDATVLVRGESGTGKELMARAVHRASERRGPFVAVNCAAVVESLAESELYGHERGSFTGATDRRQGCFERADGGTLFLDEIGDASLSFQAKLLRPRWRTGSGSDAGSRGRGDKPRPRGGGGVGAVPWRPVLQARRGHPPPAAASGAEGGRAGSGRSPAGPHREETSAQHSRRVGRCAGTVDVVHVAGQHPGTPERTDTGRGRLPW